MMALRGVKVLEFAGLAPGPFCGKILSDFGATVTRIDKVIDNYLDVMHHGKTTIAVNIKKPKGQELVQKLSEIYDVIIEPYRPGVMEKLNLGPEVLCALNPRLIYARLTGFGQTGRLHTRAGHDINYAALSGVLSMLGRHNENPTPPINILADFAGGGLMCALGICLALLDRHNSGKGQIVDASMVEGAAYVSSWLFMSRSLPIWQSERGRNKLDGGAFYYDVYQTKDGKFMSVGALEPQFFEIFKDTLGLPELTQFITDEREQADAKCRVKAAFLQKTQDEWSKIFEDTDACVYPVLEWNKVLEHDHNAERKSFQVLDNVVLPNPAPRLSRTPGSIKSFTETNTILNTLQEIKVDVDGLIKEGTLQLPRHVSKL